MAYSEELAARIRKALARRQGIAEKKMFGGITFMLRSYMCCGVVNDDLVLRLGPEQGEKALKQPHTRQCDFTGRPLKGMVMVTPGDTKRMTLSASECGRLPTSCYPSLQSKFPPHVFVTVFSG